MVGSGLDSYQNLRPNNLVGELIEHIEETLPKFKDSDDFENILIQKENENQHSEAFCNYMTFSQTPLKFNFMREKSQKANHSVDFGIYLKGGILLFTIEAKVLPIPKSKKRMEYEYVYGKGGGIARFKEEDHGVDNKNRPLLENGMIAYIKEGEYSEWLEKINFWITEAKWPVAESLKEVYIKDIARLQSQHTTLNGSKVSLHHFWVDVSKS